MTLNLAGRSITVSANGLHHHLLTYGESQVGDVVILPGITSPAATADFVAAPLSEMGFRVYVPDLRGRGRTEIAPAGSYTLKDYAADLRDIIAELRLSRPLVIGHSLGARIAAAHAVLHGSKDHAPIILVDPPLSGPGRAPYPTSLESFMTQLREAKAGTTVDAVRRFYPKWPERELRIRIEVLPSCDETAVAETHAGFESEDFLPYWKKMTPPTALIRGAESPVVPEESVAELEALNSSVKIVSVPKAGHMVPWDNFSGFMAVLKPLLGEQR